jgi:hypothetical protein
MNESSVLAPSQPAGLPLYLTPQQWAALRGGASLRQLEVERQRGTGAPFIKAGRRILYRRETCLEWLNSQEFISTAAVRKARQSAA